MADLLLPLLVDPDELEQHLEADQLCIIDLNKAEHYQLAHVPGAIHLDYARIIRMQKPVMGLLPDAPSLSEIFSALGINAHTHVVAYDDEGGGRACRLLYTLEVIGHTRYSLLNGGSIAWTNEGHPLTRTPHLPTPQPYPVHIHPDTIATKEYILEHLGDPNIVLLDARSTEEFTGAKRFAERGGHIPGAVHLDWRETFDLQRNTRIKPDAELMEIFAQHGVTPDKEIITYCQTHHRSSHTFILLKKLGFNQIKGYPGAWSEWGNDPHLPIETQARLRSA